MTHHRLFRVAICALVAVVSLSSLEAAQVEDRIVAVVNSDLIMLSEIKRELAPERERLKKQHRGDELARRLKIAESMILTTMIEDLVRGRRPV